jgi:hypothetical protein
VGDERERRAVESRAVWRLPLRAFASCFVVLRGLFYVASRSSQSALQRPENRLEAYLRLRRFASDESNSVSWATEAASLKSLRPTDAFLCCW